MKIVLKTLLKYKKDLLIILLTVIITTLCTLGLPLLLTVLIDTAIPDKNIPLVFKIFTAMALLVALGLFCGVMTSRSSAKVSMGVGRDMRSMVFKKVQYFSQAEIDKFSASSLITRTNNDVNQIQLFLNQCLRIAVQAPIMCLCGMILAVYNSPQLSSVLVISIPLMAVALTVIAKIAIPLSTKIQGKIDRINLVMREKITDVRVIRAFGTSGFESEKFDAINRDYQKKQQKAAENHKFGASAFDSDSFVYNGDDYAYGGKPICKQGH
ncbi:MAG: ABC transporter ATP-binding protein [Clostridiales bacterium]|nr:ABC transporter ATP-binding protein [Clostridiales bacterium]